MTRVRKVPSRLTKRLGGTFQLFECDQRHNLTHAMYDNAFTAAKFGDMPSLKYFVENFPWWKRMFFGGCDVRKTLDYALQHGQMEASKYLLEHLFPVGDIMDEEVLVSAVLSGYVPIIELVAGRISKIDNRLVLVACAKSDVSEDVWVYCLKNFPCHDMGPALYCALLYKKTNAIAYILDMMDNVPTKAKLWCVNVSQLKMIHAKNESWPDDFLSKIDDREMREFYVQHHVSDTKRKLAEVFGVIEELSIPEGDYLRVCKLMKELHDVL